MKSSKHDDHGARTSAGSDVTSVAPAGAAQASAQLFDLIVVVAMVAAERDLAGQPPLARPARHRVRRHSEQLRDVRAGQEPLLALPAGGGSCASLSHGRQVTLAAIHPNEPIAPKA